MTVGVTAVPTDAVLKGMALSYIQRRRPVEVKVDVLLLTTVITATEHLLKQNTHCSEKPRQYSWLNGNNPIWHASHQPNSEHRVFIPPSQYSRLQSKPPQSIHLSQRNFPVLHIWQRHIPTPPQRRSIIIPQDKEPTPTETVDVIHSAPTPGPCPTPRDSIELRHFAGGTCAGLD